MRLLVFLCVLGAGVVAAGICCRVSLLEAVVLAGLVAVVEMLIPSRWSTGGGR